MNSIIKGAEAQAVIEAELQETLLLVGMFIRHYDPMWVTNIWMNFMRGVEEVINYKPALSQGLFQRVLGYNFYSGEARLDDLADRIEQELTEGAADRFHLVFSLLRELSFPDSDPDEEPHDDQERVWSFPRPLMYGVEAVAFLMHHRRHFVALAYTLPQTCRGNTVIEDRDVLKKLIVMAEHWGPRCVELANAQMLSHADPSFYVEIDDGSVRIPKTYETAMGSTLEPESLGIGDIAAEGLQSPGYAAQVEARASFLKVDERLVFSEKELLNQITDIRAAYSEFDLAGSAFDAAANFVVSMLPRCHDNYWVALSPDEYESLSLQSGMATFNKRMMIAPRRSFDKHVNTYEPFSLIGDRLVSTIPALLRYMYSLRETVLSKQRRYQIRAGFIFERKVKEILQERGFTIFDVKRIQRKEFDVIAIDREGGLVHFQVKNNRLDFTMIEENPVLYARHCRRLIRYYERALRKEEGREHLLLDRFERQSIRHYVVSKFPIPSGDPRILSLAQLHHL